MVATLCQLENCQNRGPCLGKTIKVTKNIRGSRGKQNVKATYYCKIWNLKKKTKLSDFQKHSSLIHATHWYLHSGVVYPVVHLTSLQRTTH